MQDIGLDLMNLTCYGLDMTLLYSTWIMTGTDILTDLTVSTPAIFLG